MMPSSRQPASIRQPAAVAPPPLPRTRPWLIPTLLAIVLLAVLALAAKLLLGTASDTVPIAPTSPATKPNTEQETPIVTPSPEPTPPPAPVNATPAIVDDDGKSLWVSPTDGKPLDLAYLSPGAQIIVAIRPANLLKFADAEKIRTSLGPLGQHAIETVEHTTTLPLNKIDQLIVGYQISSQGVWSITYVVHATTPIDSASLPASLPNAAEKVHDAKKYTLSSGTAYYSPGADERILVAAPEDAIADVIDLAGQSPPLRRDIERLIIHTDADRQLTIVFAPNSLFSEGQNMFSGQTSRLRDPLFWFLGDELSGAALSMNWDTNFFLELSASPTLDTPLEKASRIFAKRVADVPAKLQAYVKTLQLQPYSQKVVERFPAMVRQMAKYTRAGLEDNRIVLRCYLPATAGHNLLLATELTLATPPGTAAAPTTVATTEQVAPQSAKEHLSKITSLKFTKDTLESALDQLSQDIGIPIVIRGPDLQADGITKNQSFGIDLSNKAAEEILVEILHLANPDKTSPGTHDPRQKLVYVIESRPDKTDRIVITTRAKVKERHIDLPPAFEIEKP